METHAVTNQPPPLVDYDLFGSDPVLPSFLETERGITDDGSLSSFGTRVGSGEVYRWGFEANENPPTLLTHDRFGNRIDEVRFHPAWHSLMDLSVSQGLHSLPWENDTTEAPHLKRAALSFLVAQVEAGHFCPISMTYSAIPALRQAPGVGGLWEAGIRSRVYDRRFAPAVSKDGLLVGMGMTEKQGGSDVRANTSQAIPVDGGGPEGEYRITGHKWFTSAPMNDAFLVLAQAPGGLSCFLMPRWTPDGEVNSIRLQRLKPKLGNRSNASSEVEFEDAFGLLIGEEGRGVATIIEMVNGTRLDCVIGSAALMRQAVSQAAWHVHHRHAFGSALIEKPLMQNVIADLEIEAEAATAMMTRLAGAFDRAEADPDEDAMKRIALPIAKFWVTKRASEVVHEALECLGGNGYVEDSIMPRLFRESPLNAIWEGSGNVIALDVLRAASRSPSSLEVFLAELDRARGLDARLDRQIDGAAGLIRASADAEMEARSIVSAMARVWAASLLARFGSEDAFETYVESRFGGQGHHLYGTLPASDRVTRIARRAVPQH